MTNKEFVENYIMHDSLIDSIETDNDGVVRMVIDFAYWMQKDFVEGNPETGPLTVVFNNVSRFECPKDLPLSEISILKTSIEEDAVKFALLNDMTNDCYDIIIVTSNIEIQPMT